MRSLARTLAVRLSEPSSWAGIGALLGASGFALDGALAHSLALIGMGVAGVVAFVLPEQTA